MARYFALAAAILTCAGAALELVQRIAPEAAKIYGAGAAAVRDFQGAAPVATTAPPRLTLVSDDTEEGADHG